MKGEGVWVLAREWGADGSVRYWTGSASCGGWWCSSVVGAAPYGDQGEAARAAAEVARDGWASGAVWVVLIPWAELAGDWGLACRSAMARGADGDAYLFAVYAGRLGRRALGVS